MHPVQWQTNQGLFVDLAVLGDVRPEIFKNCVPGRPRICEERPTGAAVHLAGMDVTLQDPRSLSLGGTTQQLLSQVTSAVEAVNAHRPLKPELAIRLRESLLPDRIVASLNMEGIVATRRQTLAVMDAMRVREAVGQGEREIFNALMADEFIHDAVDRGVELSEQLIRETNRLLLHQIRSDAGVYRTGPVQLPGARFEPPQGPAVGPLMGDLVRLFPLSEALHPVIQACWLHEQFTMVHPFNDGNGRTGRLLQDWVLTRRGLLPVGIPPAQRDDYYSALESADKGQWDDLVEMVGLLQLSMIGKFEAVIEEGQQRADWISRLASAAAAKKESTQHKNYIVWRKRVESISAAFEQAARELDASSEVIGAAFRQYAALDFRDWVSVCRRGASDRSWLFSLLFFADGRPFYKTIAYLKRHIPLPRVDPFAPPRDAVAIFFTGTTAPEGSRPDFQDYEDPHIRLREILLLEHQPYVYRQNLPGTDWTAAPLGSIADVIQEFFLDVFERKAGLGA
jgi:Fic family protein